MRWRNSAALALIAATLAACAGDRPKRGFRPVADTPVRVGAPYHAGGRTWTPADDRGYDVVGDASWYGAAHAGRPTANGERFAPDRISAAHPTLPLPSYVEVTAIDTGRTILVRVNDRGPFAGGRIIDLSARAAALLGVRARGVASVRVRRVEPPEADRAALRAGRAARARPDADRATLARLDARRRGGATPSRGGVTNVGTPPAGVKRSPVPIAAADDLPVVARPGRGGHAVPGLSDSACAAVGVGGCVAYVEIATFDDADRADGLVASLAPYGRAAMAPAGGMWQVRLGPYADARMAQAALERARLAGYQGARIVRESAAGQEAR